MEGAHKGKEMTNMVDYAAARSAEVGRCSLGQNRPYNFGLDSVDRWSQVFLLSALQGVLNVTIYFIFCFAQI